MPSTDPMTSRRQYRVRNTFLIVLISIPIAFVWLEIGFVVIDRWGHDAFIRWGGLAGCTLGLLGFFIGDSERYLKQWRFWAVITVVLVFHLIAFVIILLHVEVWRLTWFTVMVFEYLPFRFLRDRFLSSPSPK